MKIGVFGGTGLVGREIITILAQSHFPVTDLEVYAGRSAGNTIETPFGDKTVADAHLADYSSLDLAFFAINSQFSLENALKATEQGCYVIDSSAAFRYEPEVPLVVPEINPKTIGDSLLIASPNCTTTIAAIPLHHLNEKYGLERVIISTYQAASGAGKKALDELEAQTHQYVQGKPIQVKEFPHQLLFNLIPHIGEFQENGYTTEEMKVYWELNKILGFALSNSPLLVSCSAAVRLPIKRAHSEAITVETRKKVDPDEFRRYLRGKPGVEVVDDPSNNLYPMPLTASNRYDVQVGRIRQSLAFNSHGLDFFVSGDQILKGAALNAVQIAEWIAPRFH